VQRRRDDWRAWSPVVTSSGTGESFSAAHMQPASQRFYLALSPNRGDFSERRP